MSQESSSLLYWVWLSQLKGVGPVLSKTLVDMFKTPENIYNVSRDEIMGVYGIGNIIGDSIFKEKSLKCAEDILNKCQKLNIKILTYKDNLYMKELRDIKNAPVLLYYKGNLRENIISVAIVGARRCSEYGKKVASEAAEFMAYNNIAVISGMAKGIDGYSHTACLKVGGYTIAILGCGLDICYPKEHNILMEKIIENGTAISEYPPGTKPLSKNFPNRNRLISAMCEKLLVVEASEKSGALITAEFAKEYNRQIFAVPHSIYSCEGKGTNKLIQEGAKIYLKPSQLLENMQIQIKNDVISKKLDDVKLNSIEESILKKISEGFITSNELFLEFNDDKQKILETLSIMEIEGKVNSIGGFWQLVPGYS